MPKPMAEALKWPAASISWRDLITTFGAGKTWADFASGENWGKFRIGMTNPAASTAGLHSLFAITDFNYDDEVSDEELKSGLVFERGVTTYVADTGKLFDGLTKQDAVSRENALAFISAFPALETEVSAYNATNPKVPLAPIYPKEGTADADYPYTVLKAPGSTARASRSRTSSTTSCAARPGVRPMARPASGPPIEAARTRRR